MFTNLDNSSEPNFQQLGFVAKGLLDQSNTGLMMNVDNRDIDLGLGLSISNQCVQTRWNNNSGAGVNAASRVDMTFVASDPLSELVWSPHNGPCLKCADSSLADKEPSLQRDVGPSYIVCSPSHSIRSNGTKDRKSTSEGNMVASQGRCHVDSEIAKSASLSKLPRRSAGPLFGSSHDHTGCIIEEVNSVEHSIEKENSYRKKEQKSLCYSKSSHLGIMKTAVTDKISTGLADQRKANLLPLLTNEPRPSMEKTELLLGEFKEVGIGVSAGNAEDIGKDSQRLDLDIALGSKILTVEQCDTLDSPLQNLPSQGRRNMELALIIKETKTETNMNGCACPNDLDELEATAENDIKHFITRDTCEQIEDIAQRGKVVVIEASSNDRRIHLCQKNGKEKEKILCEREANDRTSKDVDESQGSMESCNSAKLFSKGKRMRSFDHQFIFGSKRIKKQIQESPSSTSLVKQDSSFMSWISNMVKGLAKSKAEEGRSLAATMDFPSHEHESCDQKISLCNRTRDGGSRKMGFETVFHSLYCPGTKANESRIPIDNHLRWGSKELVSADKTCGDHIMPISCHSEDQKSLKQLHLPNYSYKQSASGNVGGPSIQIKNKKVANLACTEAKDGVSSSHSSRDEKKNTSVRGNSSDASAEGKPTNGTGNISNPRGSLWITRYSLKIPPMSNFDQCDQSACRINSSINQKSLESSKSSTDIVSVAGKGLQYCAPHTESSICFKKKSRNKYKKSVKQKPSESLKSPEEMASLFARRLDAIKHISSIAVQDTAGYPRTNCVFCGKSGHKLQDCSDIAETELEGLLRNSSLYDGAEETPHLCIKCFQLGHWAAACPSSGQFQLGTGSKRCFSLLQTEESKSKLDGSRNLKKNWSGKVFSEKGIINLDKIQNHVAPSSEDNELIDEQLNPLCNIAVVQISGAPKGMFDTIRRLWLSRTDVLKWMNSHISVSNLDGYFLRLRLGKWKEGLGGAGYYVARITGSERLKSSKSSKNQIYVSVGGIECVVESRYVSNQDFQEDELVAWWQKTIASGQIPSEADLKIKLEERKKLSF